MAVRNAIMGGTDLGDEKGLPSYWNGTFNEVTKYFPKIYTDETGGSVTASTDTVIATVTIPAGALGSSATLDIRATIRCNSGNGASGVNLFTFKIKVAGTEVESTTLQGNSSTVLIIGGYLAAIESAVDNTSAVTVTITGARSGSATNTGNCDNLVVIGYEKVLS